MNHSFRNFNILLVSLLLGACSIMGGNKNSNTVENVPSPPKNLTSSNSANNAAAPPANNSTKATPQQQSTSTNKDTQSQRIQEQKAYGGEVEEVKVNNINNVPAYYIYPKQSGVDANAPSSDNVATPNWKVSW